MPFIDIEILSCSMQIYAGCLSHEPSLWPCSHNCHMPVYLNDSEAAELVIGRSYRFDSHWENLDFLLLSMPVLLSEKYIYHLFITSHFFHNRNNVMTQ